MRALALTMTALTLAAGCGSSDDGHAGVATPPGAPRAGATSASPAAEPHTEAAVRAAAKEEFDSYAAGDYGEAWDVWSAAGKQAISRANYMRLFQLCPDVAQGVRFQIEHVTMDSDRHAHVRASRLIAMLTYRFVYEAGRWRFVPTPESMRDYRTKTVKEVAAERRAQGGCGK